MNRKGAMAVFENGVGFRKSTFWKVYVAHGCEMLKCETGILNYRVSRVGSKIQV